MRLYMILMRTPDGWRQSVGHKFYDNLTTATNEAREFSEIHPDQTYAVVGMEYILYDM